MVCVALTQTPCRKIDISVWHSQRGGGIHSDPGEEPRPAWDSEDAAWELILERKDMLSSLVSVLSSYADPYELDESMNEVWQDAERNIQAVHEHVDRALERLKAEEKERQLARKAQRKTAKEARAAHKAQRTE